jgi:hypothetical protein
MKCPVFPGRENDRALPGRGRKPGQTATAVFILPANGPNIPSPSFVTESNAPYPPEFPASPLPVKRFQPAHRPFTKQAAIATTEKPRIHCDRTRHPPIPRPSCRRKTDTSAQNPFQVASYRPANCSQRPPFPCQFPAHGNRQRSAPAGQSSTGLDSSETLPACPRPFPSAGLPVIMDTAPGQPLFFRDYANRPVSPIQTPCRHRPDRLRTPAS